MYACQMITQCAILTAKHGQMLVTGKVHTIEATQETEGEREGVVVREVEPGNLRALKRDISSLWTCYY